MKLRNCLHADTVYDGETGESICVTCGAVLAVKNVPPGDTTHNTPSNDLGGHVGGVGREILRDANGGAVCDGAAVNRHRRMQNWTNSRKGTPTAVRNGRNVIGALAAKLSLPAAVGQDAESILVAARQRDMNRGVSTVSLAAASTMVAIRRAGIPRTVEEVSRVADARGIPRIFRRLCTALEISLEPPRIDLYVTRFTSEMGYHGHIARRAMDILEDASRRGLTTGKSPAVLAAGAVYLAAKDAGLTVNQRSIARRSCISEVSIRNCSAMLRGDTPDHGCVAGT